MGTTDSLLLSFGISKANAQAAKRGDSPRLFSAFTAATIRGSAGSCGAAASAAEGAVASDAAATSCKCSPTFSSSRPPSNSWPCTATIPSRAARAAADTSRCSSQSLSASAFAGPASSFASVSASSRACATSCSATASSNTAALARSRLDAMRRSSLETRVSSELSAAGSDGAPSAAVARSSTPSVTWWPRVQAMWIGVWPSMFAAISAFWLSR